MDILITLTTAGVDTGPFDLYSDADGYTTPFETGVLRGDLLAGYTTNLAYIGTTIVRIQSTGVCGNFIDLELFPLTTTTTSTKLYYKLDPCDPGDGQVSTDKVPLLASQRYLILVGGVPHYYVWDNATPNPTPLAPFDGSVQIVSGQVGCP